MNSFLFTILLSAGSFTGSVGWNYNEVGLDVLSGKISFLAHSCNKYDLVQVAQVIDNDNKNFVWKSGEINRNKIMTEQGWFIDHQSFSCKRGESCSAYYRDHWPTEGQKGTPATAATLADYPFGWSEFKEINLETCAYCIDNKSFMGCLRWGGQFPLVGDKKVLPTLATDIPSSNFMSAYLKFKKFYK